MDKKITRIKRSRKTRARIKTLNAIRLSVHRTPRHIYAQLIAADGKVLAVTSTLDPALRAECVNGGNIAAAKLVGEAIAKKALELKISSIAFDRSGFRYHGRVKALADAARSGGLVF